MKNKLKLLLSAILCVGTLACTSPVQAETLSSSYGTGWSNWQDTCPTGMSCQTKTFNRYRDVASWSETYSTTKPSDGFYTSKNEYNVYYSKTTQTSQKHEFGYNATTAYFDGMYVTQVLVNNYCHSARGTLYTNYCTINNDNHGGGQRGCTTSAKWGNSITISGGSPGYKEYSTTTWSCAGTADKTYLQFGSVVVIGYTNSTTNGYTGWQSNTSAPAGTSYVSHSTRTVYAPPASWGSWSAWAETAIAGSTSRQVESKTFYSYPLTYTINYDANGGTGTMNSDTATYGQPYRTQKNAFTKTGYTFNGWNEKADGTGTAWGLNSSGVYEAGKDWTWTYQNNITLYAQWKINTYTNSIAHWVWGFKNQEGNNETAKNAFYLGSTTFTQNYGDVFTFNENKMTTIPNGFATNKKFASSAFNEANTWTQYTFGTEVTQPAKNANVEFDYYPINYTITYDLGDGTNASSNPSSYNVLYGVTFAEPTRAGYTFEGWYIDGVKVTGINSGANATFESADDLYAKLATRTTGNKTVVAKWTTNYIRYTVECLVDSNGNLVTETGNIENNGQYKKVTKTFDVPELDTATKSFCIGKFMSKTKVHY